MSDSKGTRLAVSRRDVRRRLTTWWSMARDKERIFRINDEIAALRRDEHLAFEELIMLGHLDDDAQREAAVSGNPMDAAEARDTAGDVARMERHVQALRAARERLERKRDGMLEKLSS
jgi:ubiquinone biosynthesis protein UbiJ